MQALQSAGSGADLSHMSMLPCVVLDRGVSDQTMNAALAALQSLVDRKQAAAKKPWRKFW